MKNLATIGRILFALPIGLIGLNHFLMKDIFLGMMTSFIPGGGFTILLTGAILIFLSVSIIINKFIQVSCYVLAILLFIFICSIHIPGLFDSNYEMALMGLLKDVSLMGGALIIAVYFKPAGTQQEKS
jgi:putative oxidoreductase